MLHVDINRRSKTFGKLCRGVVSDLFQKLFRQDLLVASLFRNFLLAERVMRSYNCTPISTPKLPPMYQHPMWLVPCTPISTPAFKISISLTQPFFISLLSAPPHHRQAWDLALDVCLAQLPAMLNDKKPFEHSLFFAEQLTAFQVWLSHGSELRPPPEQLPIVLQVSEGS